MQIKAKIIELCRKSSKIKENDTKNSLRPKPVDYNLDKILRQKMFNGNILIKLNQIESNNQKKVISECGMFKKLC